MATAKPLINLLRGWPSTALLPIALLKAATNNVLDNPEISVPGLLYGPDPGHPRLRESLATWLTTFYNPSSPISPERITITGGASQNLACLLQVFTDPLYTRNVWIVAPAYFLAFRIFEDSGFHGKLRAVPEDDEGIDIEYLRQEIRKSEDKAAAEGNSKPTLKPPRPWSKIYRHIIYAVPTFSNPSFKTMSLKRREDIVRVAREFDALVITDDVYDFLQWPAKVDAKCSKAQKAILPRIVDVDRFLDGGPNREGADGFGNAASNGSFSKICGPGLRTGWVEGTDKLAWGVSQTGSTRSGGSPSQLTSTYVADLLESGDLQSYVYDVLQPSLAQRYREMINAIEKHLIPLGVALPQTDREIVGGYFIWISLPKPLKAAEVTERAKSDSNLIVAAGELFEVPGDASAAFPHDIRLCFSWEEQDKLGEGIMRLASVIQTLQQEGHEGQAMRRGTEHGQNGEDETRDFW